MKKSADLQIERAIALWPSLSHQQQVATADLLEALADANSAPRTAVEVKDDAALIDAARRAQHEAGSFTDAFRSIGMIDGSLEILHHLLNASGEPPDDVNWSSVGSLIDGLRRRSTELYCMIGHLEAYERKRDQEAA